MGIEDEWAARPLLAELAQHEDEPEVLDRAERVLAELALPAETRAKASALATTIADLGTSAQLIAMLLHIGQSQPDSGLEPLDGALLLKSAGFDAETCSQVAWLGTSRHLYRARGIDCPFEPPRDRLLADRLWLADLTTMPDGRYCTLDSAVDVALRRQPDTVHRAALDAQLADLAEAARRCGVAVKDARWVNAESFERMVGAAFDAIPDEFAGPMATLVLVIEDERAGRPGLLGLYEGVPETQRPLNDGGLMPHRITIFRDPILRRCRTRADVEREVTTVVRHEYGHLLGMGEARLHELGYGA